MPTFTDGGLVHQGSLNRLSAGVDSVGRLLTGAPAPRAYIPTATASLAAPRSTTNRVDALIGLATFGINNDFMAGSGGMFIQTGGVYVAFAQVSFAPNASGTRSCSILLNGFAPDGNGVALAAEKAVSATDITTVTCETQPMMLAAGSALFLNAWQSSGGPLNVVTGLSGTFMSVTRLGE
jgi:hypothetical protein